MGKQNRFFEMNGKKYEFLAVAKNFDEGNQEKMGIFREVDADYYGVMTLKKLWSYLNHNKGEQILNQRLTLYKERFVGRTDVYAKRYFNKKADKDVYAPDVPFDRRGRPMKNHWLPITNEVLKVHLTGEKFIGFYPMYPNNTTKFLVLDIDGHHQGDHWQAITLSIKKVCHQHQIPILVELSQSGNGCHIWVFFTNPISANRARKLGDGILKATMAINPELSFSAFDRLFPSQDVIGQNKLGNLIAGPLQGNRRNDGRSVFVDEKFKPLPNQWQLLADVPLLDEDAVEHLIESLNTDLNVRLYDDQSDETNLLKPPLLIEQKLSVIRANGLYIKKSGLTTQQVNQLRWLASFRNPVFYQKQQKRLSTFGEPRIIATFDETESYLVLPKGLEDELVGLAPNLVWEDQTVCGQSIHVTFKGKLFLDQQHAFDSLMAHQTGVLAARTGFGKTVVAAKLIAAHGVSTLILVHDKSLAKQWQAQLTQFLKIEDRPFVVEYTPSGRLRQKKQIGAYYGNNHNRSGIIDIATIQSFKQDQASRKILDQYGMIISDEVHHDAAFTYEQVIKQLKCRFLYGLSATPYRRDGQEPIVTMRFGPIRYQTSMVDEKSLFSTRRIMIPRFTDLGMASLEIANNNVNENYQAICEDKSRNNMLIADIKENLAEGRHILFLTRRIAHLKEIAKQLKGISNIFYLYGGQKDRANTETIASLKSVKHAYVVLATSEYAGEGLDITSLDTLILGMPHSWKGNSVQYLGRMQRDLPTKPEIRVYDYVDMFVPMLVKMYQRRQKVYHELGYKIVADKQSQQAEIAFFNGGYQTLILDETKVAKQLFICTTKLSKFILNQVLAAAMEDAQIQIITNQLTPQQSTKLKKMHVSVTLYDYRLPTCCIFDHRKMWLSSDPGFDYNSGIAIWVKHPELSRQFGEMLKQTVNEIHPT